MASHTLSAAAGRAVGRWLCLAVALLACGCAGAQRAKEGEAGRECFAVVEYAALVEDPEKANLTDSFKGELKVKKIDAKEIVNGSIKLAWTFSAGATLEGKSSITEDPTKFIYSSETVDEQMITLWWNDSAGFSDGSLSTVRFVGEKGNSAPADAGFTNYTMAAPNSVALNDYQCVPIGPEDELVAISKEEANRGDLVLSYMPIELTSFRSSDGFVLPATTFAFRIVNEGSRVVDLKHVRLEYWFDGDDSLLATDAKDLPFKSNCRSSTTNCSLMVTKVRTGQRGVQGAKFKVEISFLEGAGNLPPTQNLPTTEQDVSMSPPFVEAIINITSIKILGQMNSTRDFSYLETEIDANRSFMADIPDFVNHVYAENQRIPVYLKGERVWGSSPEGVQDKVEQVGGSQLQCGSASFGRAGCGLRQQYCCDAKLKVAVPMAPTVPTVFPTAVFVNATVSGTPEGSSIKGLLAPLIGSMIGGFAAILVIAWCWRMAAAVINRRSRSATVDLEQNDNQIKQAYDPM
ncbi:unnamed protein product [Ostreobium quekettii]|uniref:CBM3 domain-containing protein n=1 Tax=Ostreobium quekettii TaxID=121088 RepID=A0A8S1J914_9CHLO|nr:unnamed protein product [Ostreobium quekettii]|eukprot:evm.model.scf_222.13 EVM.evm.TU.scf_222.13   scf_222:104680-113183(-)